MKKSGHTDVPEGVIAVQALNMSDARASLQILVFAKRKTFLDPGAIVQPPPNWDPKSDPDFTFAIETPQEVEPGDRVSVVSNPIRVDLTKFFFYVLPDRRGRFLLEVFVQGKNSLAKPGSI